MASGVYSNGIQAFIGGSIDYDADTIKAMLVVNTYTLDKEAHDVVDDVSASRMTGTTDQTLGSKAVNEDTGNTRVEVDSANITWSSVQSGSTVSGYILYKDTSTPASDPLICFCEFSSPVATNGSNITATVDANGHFYAVYGA